MQGSEEMTGGGEHKNIIIKYGPEEHRVSLPQNPDPFQPHLVRDLAFLIEKVCRIPVDSQRIIFKGKSLLDLDATLFSYGIRNNSKVMVIMGNKPSKSTAESGAMDSLRTVHVKSEALAEDLDNIEQKIRNVQQGLVSENPETIKRLLLGNADSYMRLLESMDALDLPSGSNEPKTKRKELVHKIQTFLDRNDNLKAVLDTLVANS
ncbi:BAG family molecular chaperone regulator 1-like [Convolutriloba macropyga]|uniref:BAG family molecular chaperone regulator 1-like n=1 Tax=Convolutriloba macropyga TaxID=536237 RepID=UPI003F525B67